MKRLPDAELEIMKALWKLDKPATRAEIMENVNPEPKWAPTTVLSMLSRLGEKGFVVSEKAANGNLYSARIARDDYLKNESQTVLDKLFDGSPKNFMTSLVQSNSLSDDDLLELRSYLDEVRKGRD